ncbi:formin-like protein 18 isoform X2 [Papio anubis]|uniref:formin-like protein 18 isoform X2 n=1 Tax=Papio anubis TaxID=9555 RepID=UPI000B7B375B|nr:formin-like protein 18 isoform X2 [Papio anubis]
MFGSKHGGETPPSKLQGLGAAPRATPGTPEELPARAPAPAPPRPAHRRSAVPPRPRRRSGARPSPSAVTCCRGRLPPHTTPCSGDGGGRRSRGSHMRRPWPPASRSRGRGPPRFARIRGAGPAEGANAAPPLRLWLPREKPSFPVPRCLRLVQGPPAPRQTTSASGCHRVCFLRLCYRQSFSD